jgi:hypothetical protein
MFRFMAFSAIDPGMCPFERISGLIMIECLLSIRPVYQIKIATLMLYMT